MQIYEVLEPAPTHYVIIVRLYSWVLARKVLFNADVGLPDGTIMVGLPFNCFPSEFYLAVREEDNCAARGGSRGRFEQGSRAAENFVEFLVSALAGLTAVEVATMAAGTTEGSGVVAHCTVRER